jgi:hypothetical protein
MHPMEKIEEIPLRMVGNSIYLRVPRDFVRANQLRAGDVVLWNSESGNFRIVQLATLKEPAVLREDLEAARQELAAAE